MMLKGMIAKGSVKKKCLAPVWLERFELPCEDPDSVFSFEVMDHDNFGAADFMGCVPGGNRRPVKCLVATIKSCSSNFQKDRVDGVEARRRSRNRPGDSLVDSHIRCKVKLATLKDERAHRNWHKLGNTSGEQDEHERGEVELCLRWCHDKARAYDLPKEFKTSVKKRARRPCPTSSMST